MADDKWDQFEVLLREELSGRVANLVLDEDDPILPMMGTFEPLSVAGRHLSSTAGFQASYDIKISEAGAVGGGVWSSANTTTALGKDTHLFTGQTVGETYLDPTLVPMRSYVKINMDLQRIKGNLTVNRSQILTDLAANPLEDVASTFMEDITSKHRHYLASFFWGDGTSALATVKTAPAGGNIVSAAGGTEITLSSGTFGRFKLGDRVILVATGSLPADIRNNGTEGIANERCYVVNIDRKDRTIHLQANSGTVTGVVAGDRIVLEDTVTIDTTVSPDDVTAWLVPEGVESLLLDTGTFPGSPGSGYTVEDHFYLRSFVRGDESNMVNPTPEIIARELDEIADAGYPPPQAVFAERGIWTLYGQLERQTGVQYTVPQGGGFIASGGVQGPMISHMNHQFQRFTSIRMRPNSIVGLTPSVWKKFMPLGDMTINWLYGSGPMSGINSIFNAVHSGSQSTELAEAPWDSAAQFGCEQPGRNFRRIGVKAQRDVG